MTLRRLFTSVAVAAAAVFGQQVHAQSITRLNIISDTTAVGMADSSAVIYTRTFDRMALALKVLPAAGTAAAVIPFVRLAVQVRGHTDAETPVTSYLRGAAYPPAVAPIPDSTNTFAWMRAESNPAVTSASTADSLVFSSDTTGAGIGQQSSEIIVNVVYQVNSMRWGAPGQHDLYIPLVAPGNIWFWAPWTSVRIRVLNAHLNTPRIVCHLIGSTQR